MIVDAAGMMGSAVLFFGIILLLSVSISIFVSIWFRKSFLENFLAGKKKSISIIVQILYFFVMICVLSCALFLTLTGIGIVALGL